MWEPVSNPQTLVLPEQLGSDFSAAWIEVRKSSSTDVIPEISHLQFVDAEEAATFKVAKRAEEHAAGRFLLAHLLKQNGYRVGQFTIQRDEFRRPTLVGVNPPAISISHSGGFATAIIAPSHFSIGIDLEPDTGRQSNLLPLMATCEELAQLESAWAENPVTASTLTNQTWVQKEAIQKATGLGMGLAPQSFEVLGKQSVDINSRRYMIVSWDEILGGQQSNIAVAFTKISG